MRISEDVLKSSYEDMIKDLLMLFRLYREPDEEIYKELCNKWIVKTKQTNNEELSHLFYCLRDNKQYGIIPM